MTLSDQRFEDVSVEMDGKTFQGCTFKKCKLLYRATGPVELRDCELTDVDWVFLDTAEETISLLRTIAQQADDLGELMAALVTFPRIEKWIRPEGLRAIGRQASDE